VLLKAAIPALSADQMTTLQALTPERWAGVRTEAARVLDTVERTELKDTQVPLVRTTWPGGWRAT